MLNDNEMKEMEAKRDAMKTILKMMGEVSNDPKILFKLKEIELREKLDLIALNMEGITDNQYKELTNIVEQFEKFVDDYLKENNIELKEEN